MLGWAFPQLRKDAAAGVDGVTSEDYSKDLRSNLADLYQRLKEGRYRAQSLIPHPEKTRLIQFGRSAWVKGKKTGAKPETFNFLGFIHYCGTTRKGKFSVKVNTMKKRLGRRRIRQLGEIWEDSKSISTSRAKNRTRIAENKISTQLVRGVHLRNRLREICTSGSARGLQERSWGSTRTLPHSV
jgi:hypothetical protein